MISPDIVKWFDEWEQTLPQDAREAFRPIYDQANTFVRSDLMNEFKARDLVRRLEERRDRYAPFGNEPPLSEDVKELLNEAAMYILRDKNRQEQ